jgi:hypothetical protein
MISREKNPVVSGCEKDSRQFDTACNDKLSFYLKIRRQRADTEVRISSNIAPSGHAGLSETMTTS